MSLPTIRFKPSGLVIVMRRWPVRDEASPSPVAERSRDCRTGCACEARQFLLSQVYVDLAVIRASVLGGKIEQKLRHSLCAAA